MGWGQRAEDVGAEFRPDEVPTCRQKLLSGHRLVALLLDGHGDLRANSLTLGKCFTKITNSRSDPGAKFLLGLGREGV